MTAIASHDLPHVKSIRSTALLGAVAEVAWPSTFVYFRHRVTLNILDTGFMFRFYVGFVVASK